MAKFNYNSKFFVYGVISKNNVPESEMVQYIGGSVQKVEFNPEFLVQGVSNEIGEELFKTRFVEGGDLWFSIKESIQNLVKYSSEFKIFVHNNETGEEVSISARRYASLKFTLVA